MAGLDLSTPPLASGHDISGDLYDPDSTTSHPAWTRALAETAAADVGVSQPADHGADSSTHTTTASFGAPDQTTATVTNGVDLAQGLAGGGATIATGLARQGTVTAERTLAAGMRETEALTQTGGKAASGAGDAGHTPGITSSEPHEAPHAATHDAPAVPKADATSETLKNGETLSSGKPPVELDHVFQGEVSPKRGVDAAKGFHHALGDALQPNARVVRELSSRNAHGVYEAEVEVTKPGTGAAYTKRSTMFPDSMSRDDVVKSPQNAYDNARSRSGNAFTGPSGHDFDVTGYTSGAGADLHIRTGYPVYTK